MKGAATDVLGLQPRHISTQRHRPFAPQLNQVGPAHQTDLPPRPEMFIRGSPV